MTGPFPSAWQAGLDGSREDRRRERLLDERNRLENSFGRGNWVDGRIRDRIAEIDATLSQDKHADG